MGVIGLYSEADARMILREVRKLQQQVQQVGQQPHRVHVEDGITFTNNTGETVPAYGVFAITDVIIRSKYDVQWKIAKPSTTFYPCYGVNDSNPVPDGKNGQAQVGPDYRILFDNSATPAAGQGWGPKPGYWSVWQGLPSTTIASGIVNVADKVLSGTLAPITTMVGRLTAAVDANTPSTDYTIYANGLASGFTGVPEATSAIDLGSGTWVILKFIGNAFAILPYANLIWHVTFGSTVAGGSSGSVTLPDGRTVTYTNQSNTTINAADRGSVYEDLTNQVVYSTGGGTGSNPDNMAVVTVNSANADGNCLWPGKIASPNTSNTYCADQFPDGADCFLTVLNSKLGSTSTPTPVLTVDEHYVGRHVGDYDNGDDTFTPIYAIRIEPESGGSYRGTLNATLQVADTTATVTGLKSMADGSSLSVTTVDNQFGRAGVNGSKVLVEKDYSSGSLAYTLTQVKHVAQAAVTNSKVDSTSLTTKIQQTKRTIAVMSDGNDDTADTTVVDLVDQVIVDNVKVDDGTTPTELQQTKKTIKRFPTTNSDGDTNVVGIDPC